MAIEFRRGGRKMSQNDFVKGMMDDAIDQVMTNYGRELHGKAASVVDPETGKHVPVFVRRIGRQGWRFMRMDRRHSRARSRRGWD